MSSSFRSDWILIYNQNNSKTQLPSNWIWTKFGFDIDCIRSASVIKMAEQKNTENTGATTQIPSSDIKEESKDAGQDILEKYGDLVF